MSGIDPIEYLTSVMHHLGDFADTEECRSNREEYHVLTDCIAIIREHRGLVDEIIESESATPLCCCTRYRSK